MDISSISFFAPLALNPLFALLLLSVNKQQYTPTTKEIFKDEYDYIIVGAGSAGSALAGRLSEISCVSILLLEAGLPPPILTEIPAFAIAAVETDIDWQFRTVPQRYAGSAHVNQTVPIPSGKTLGGSSVINGMINVRGNRLNFDGWSRLGARGWSYNEVLPYFKKLEDNKDERYVSNGFHGVGGPITTSMPNFQSEVKEAITEAALNLGYNFADPNGIGQEGFYDIQGTIRNGQRCSTAKAYLVPAEKRPNLDIVSNALATKIDIQNQRAVGVYFKHKGVESYVRARNEVILSAGAYNTPKLLMLSGIGPLYELDRFKIPVIADLPVGLNLQDHYGGILAFELSDSIPNAIIRLFNETNIRNYIHNRAGPYASLYGLDLIAFLSSNITAVNDVIDQQLYFIEAPAQAVFTRGITPEVQKRLFDPYKDKAILICLSQTIDPKSRGNVRLRSTNPRDLPVIDPNYYENLQDLKTIVEGMKTCLKILTHPALSKVGAKMMNLTYPGCERFVGDALLACIARAVVISDSHHVGTAKMGDVNDPTTVVDSELRVKTIEGLRVVDASVMPTITWGNTNIPTIMIAEKASDLIKSTITCTPQDTKTKTTISPS